MRGAGWTSKPNSTFVHSDKISEKRSPKEQPVEKRATNEPPVIPGYTRKQNNATGQRLPVPEHILGRPSPRDFPSSPREGLREDRRQGLPSVDVDDDDDRKSRDEKEGGAKSETGNLEDSQEDQKPSDEPPSVRFELISTTKTEKTKKDKNLSKNNNNNNNNNNNFALKATSSTKGVGYCPGKVVKGVIDESSFPRVPQYGRYSNLLPPSYIMPWKQDMKNRSTILENIRSAGKEKLPNIEHNDFLFLRHREQISPNVEKREEVEKRRKMPSIGEILNPPFHHHTIKTKDSQRKAIFPAMPAMDFHHPRLRHVTGCYACKPDYDE